MKKLISILMLVIFSITFSAVVSAENRPRKEKYRTNNVHKHKAYKMLRYNLKSFRKGGDGRCFSAPSKLFTKKHKVSNKKFAVCS